MSNDCNNPVRLDCVVVSLKTALSRALVMSDDLNVFQQTADFLQK